MRGDGEWQSFCGLIGESELSRVSNQDALDALLGTWTSGFDRYEVMARCQAAGIAAGAVQDAEDLTGRDPQLADRRFFGSASSETLGDYGIDQFPALFNGVRPSRYEGVHQTGEDTFDVVTAVLGLPDEQFAELAARGVFT